MANGRNVVSDVSAEHRHYLQEVRHREFGVFVEVRIKTAFAKSRKFVLFVSDSVSCGALYEPMQGGCNGGDGDGDGLN